MHEDTKAMLVQEAINQAQKEWSQKEDKILMILEEQTNRIKALAQATAESQSWVSYNDGRYTVPPTSITNGVSSLTKILSLESEIASLAIKMEKIDNQTSTHNLVDARIKSIMLHELNVF